MQKKLKFYDLKKKKSFKTRKYDIRTNKRGAKVAVATSPSGTESWRMLPKDFKP